MKLLRSHTDKYIDLLDGWEGKLTWEKLILEAGKHHGLKFTRQTLVANSSVKSAYELTKSRISSNQKKTLPSFHKLTNITECHLINLIASMDRMKIEISRLTKENEEYINKFLVWSYNASNKGMTEYDLNKPLPTVNRFPTKIRKD